MEIKKNVIEQPKDPELLFSDLIFKSCPDYSEDTFDNLDIVSQTFVLILIADGQTNNGGIIQFIDNGSGNRFHETVEAAKRIKSEILTDLLTRASRQFPDEHIPTDWDERRKLYDELCERYTTYKTFNELSSEEKQIVLEGRRKYGDTTPLDQLSFEQENSWSDTWEELDSLYYQNRKIIYKNLIGYLKHNANLVD